MSGPRIPQPSIPFRRRCGELSDGTPVFCASYSIDSALSRSFHEEPIRIVVVATRPILGPIP